MPDTTLTSAIDQLQNHQTQLDMDGVAVGVSRQALDIVLDALARAGLEAGKAEESMRERAALEAEGIGEAYGMDETGWAECSETVATAIRALPLTGVDKP